MKSNYALLLSVLCIALMASSLSVTVFGAGGPGAEPVETRGPGDPAGADVVIVNTTIGLVKYGAADVPDVIPTQDIKLYITVRNIEPGVENYTIQIDWQQSGNVKITTLVTNVNYTGNLVVGQQTHINLTTTIPALASPVNSTLMVKAQPTIDTDNFDFGFDQVSFNVLQKAVIGMKAVTHSKSADPGLGAEYRIEFTNLGNIQGIVGNFGVRFTDHLNWTASFDHTELPVPADGTQLISLDILVPHNAEARAYVFEVEAWLLDSNYTASERISNVTTEMKVNPIAYVVVDEITLDPYPPYSGRPINVTARVNNIGTQNAIDVPVRFYLDLMDAEHMIFEANVTIPSGSYADVSFEREMAIGNTTLYVAAYPNASAAYSETELGQFTNSSTFDVRTDPSLPVFVGFIGITAFVGIFCILAMVEKYRMGPMPLPDAPIRPEKEEEDPLMDDGLALDGEDDDSMLDLESELELSIDETPLAAPAPPPKKLTPARKKEGPTPRTSYSTKKGAAPAPKKGPGDVSQELRSAEQALKQAKNEGVDVTSIEKLLEQARGSVRAGENDKAMGQCRIVKERTDSLLKKHRDARDTIREAKSTISSLKWEDVDLSTPKSFVQRAEAAFKSGDYSSAMTYANKAKKRALKLDQINKFGGK